ncbi:uncharacterized protein EMH_0084910 [Eimeria mitis]|uniref:Uncharacterized protein n=1 Tax=Eimeria mitis TaxID=44415 RepID=U6KLV6_9EIME|nr:uncharacterized protein EMH_0084910 [Eimeria mitis]CDJ36423.1 hypothetical protein EMH_0084910 [Eimeria mitis]
MVGTDESRSALQELCSSVKRSQDIAQTIAESSAGSSGSPLTAVKTAIEDSVSALSRLYEAARERGLSLAQEVQKERAPVFSEEEMQLLENGLGAGFREFMDFREQNLNSSLPVFVQKVERAAAELKGLRSIDGMDDLHLLMSVAKNLEMVKSACDSMQTEFACSDAIRASATTVLHMQYQREHASIHRELAGQVGEVRILCVLERQRRQIHPQQDISLLKSFRWLEKRLYRGEQQLQKHKEMIERMEEADNIISASNVEQQARTVVDSLKALLKAASSSWNSIPGAVSGGEAAQSEAMQGHLTAVACRAIGEAAAAGGRAVSMLNAVEAQGLGDSTLSWNKEEEGIKQPALQRRVNANLAKLIADALKQVDHVNAAMRKPVDADEETQEGRSSSEILMEEMLRASRTAAKASEAFVHDAELMWLRAQLNNSLDLDMQLSATLAQRATAAVGMATGEEPTQQRWHPEMSADDIKEFKDLLEQFHHLRDGALSANALNERASAAAMMKQAALKLTVFAEERQEQPRRR